MKLTFFKQELKYVEYFMFSFFKWNLKEKRLKESSQGGVIISLWPSVLSCKLADTQLPYLHPSPPLRWASRKQTRSQRNEI